MSPLLALEFLLLAALWGASFLFTRLGAAELGAVPTAGMRVALAALFLLPVFLVKGVWADFRQHAGRILYMGLFNSGLPFALYAFAVLHITTGLSSILNATVPLSGALVAWLWLKDRPTRSRMLGLAVGFAGVTLLVMGKSGFSATGVAGQGDSAITLLAMGACVLATLSYGYAASFTKRYLTGVNPLATATGSQIGAALGLAIPTAWLWPSQAISATAWGALVAVGLLCTAIAYILFFHIIAKAGPSRALAVTFLVPVFALFYGVVLLGEAITPWMIGCGVVIVCGTALSTGLAKVRWLDARST
ncbi:DMT family transporter [Hydrogenophaga sp. BPS33]|uniref:DMT family transporter n=1 Tax=Hydrogenophaga sp. BPS33 TaxID=2651974 RepID=UPI00131F8B58|nr:DMT family transporter [Hydrogenophaga sp. BPS33]QHE87350.1 DMT family transporter [Hydrogenophaga sp. BPS33]